MDIISFTVLALMWVYVIVQYPGLPQTVPSHFDFRGRPDDYSSKEVIFLLPLIVTVISIGIKTLGRNPHTFNYLVPLTPENKERQYQLSLRMLKIINLIITVAFSYTAYKVVHDTREGSSLLDWWFLPLFIGSILVITVFFMWKSRASR